MNLHCVSAAKTDGAPAALKQVLEPAFAADGATRVAIGHRDLADTSVPNVHCRDSTSDFITGYQLHCVRTLDRSN
jgi:hypothetical protein